MHSFSHPVVCTQQTFSPSRQRSAVQDRCRPLQLPECARQVRVSMCPSLVVFSSSPDSVILLLCCKFDGPQSIDPLPSRASDRVFLLRYYVLQDSKSQHHLAVHCVKFTFTVLPSGCAASDKTAALANNNATDRRAARHLSAHASRQLERWVHAAAFYAWLRPQRQPGHIVRSRFTSLCPSRGQPSPHLRTSTSCTPPLFSCEQAEAAARGDTRAAQATVTPVRRTTTTHHHDQACRRPRRIHNENPPGPPSVLHIHHHCQQQYCAPPVQPRRHQRHKHHRLWRAEPPIEGALRARAPRCPILH